jgi:hypothetical protein
MFYATYQDGITDNSIDNSIDKYIYSSKNKSLMEDMLLDNDELKKTDITYVLNNRFFTIGNVKNLAKKNYKFIIPIDNHDKIVKTLTDLSRETIKNEENRINSHVYGAPFHSDLLDPTVTTHVFFDQKLYDYELNMFHEIYAFMKTFLEK